MASQFLWMWACQGYENFLKHGLTE